MDTKKLRQKILDLAIRGKLVPQDPNDEPASLLLERIRTEKERLIKEGKIKRSKKTVEDDEIEIPFEIPESWEWCRLSDIASYGGGKTPSMDNKKYWLNGKNLWITSKDMKYERINNSLMRISDDALPFMTQYEPGTLLLVTRSGILRHSLPIAILEEKATVNQDLKTISLHLRRMHEYVYYAIKARESFILKEYHKDGTTVDSINFEKFSDILLPIPPLAEQKRIVNEVERWFTLIDELESNEDDLVKAIDKAKSKILDLAIHGKLVPQNPNDEPASVLMNCIREEKKRLVKEGKLKKKDLEDTPINEDEIPFDIPESWEWVRLGYISTYASTKKKINATKADPNLWGLDLEDIEKGGRLLCIKSVGERKAIGEKTCFSEGDILYSKLRPYLLKILIAPKDGICTPEIIPFNCYGSICKDYIVCLLKSSYVDDYINSVTFGVKMPRVSTDTLVSLIIPLPPLAEQKRIAEKIEKAFKAIDELS